jgi:hypothetical protein
VLTWRPASGSRIPGQCPYGRSPVTGSQTGSLPPHRGFSGGGSCAVGKGPSVAPDQLGRSAYERRSKLNGFSKFAGKWPCVSANLKRMRNKLGPVPKIPNQHSPTARPVPSQALSPSDTAGLGGCNTVPANLLLTCQSIEGICTVEIILKPESINSILPMDSRPRADMKYVLCFWFMLLGLAHSSSLRSSLLEYYYVDIPLNHDKLSSRHLIPPHQDLPHLPNPAPGSRSKRRILSQP